MKETKKSFSAEVTPRINVGFSEEKDERIGEVIDAKFECTRVVTKKDKDGVDQTYVILLVHGSTGVGSKVYNAADLLGRDTHPCVKKGKEWIVEDEKFVCTWQDELVFNEKA